MRIFLPGRFDLLLIRDQIGRCDLCGTPFYGDRDTVAHLNTAEHRDAVEAQLEEREAHKRRLALFHEADDPEVEAHLKDVGRQMLREGRWEVKPNERAGFS